MSAGAIQFNNKNNPFPGLRPFTQEEDYLFFGREEQTLELLQRLGSNRFVAVVGTSGSGKSSLVRCGLLSELLGGRMLDAGSSWEIAVTHPGGNPLALLTQALLDADLYDREADHARENLLATLSRSHFGLIEAVKQAGLADGTNFLLVVDQFEEIFRFHEAGQQQQEAANEFVSLLLESAAQKDVPIYVVLTMRSDFIGECGQFEGLAEMVNRGEFLIPRLNRDQFKRVIEGPIKVAGGQITPRLLQRLLNDLGHQADQLPCLQHALMRTWNVWSAKGDSEALDLDDYQRVGKMSQALSLHADEIYESLANDRQRELCQGIFQALTVEESNNRGIRRPQRLGRLGQILQVSVDELRPIIDAYRQRGVTFLMPPPEVELTEQTIIDISHESLMRVWTRLRQWVEEETQAAGIYLRLSESADLHAEGKAGLYRDPELGIALAWRESKRPNAAWADRYRRGFARAIAFLEASQQASLAEEQAREAARQHQLEQAQQLAEAQQQRLEHQQRAARKLRKLIGGLAAVALIAVLACIAALFANQRANLLAENARQNEERAKESTKRAERSQRETAEALAVVASQKKEVEQSLSKAESAEEAGRKLLYTTDMRLAPFVWRDDRATSEQLRVLLAKHVPPSELAESNAAAADDKPDLRGFEWHYYQYLLEHSATVFAGHVAKVKDGAFTSTGQLVTLDENGQTRRWNIHSQVEDPAGRHELNGGASAPQCVLSPNGRLVALAKGSTIHVYDVGTGNEAFQINFGNAIYRRFIFSGDGSWLVIVDDKIRWFSDQGIAIASFDQRFDRIESIALAHDGLTLAIVGHSSVGSLFSTYRLDATAKKVTRLAKDTGPGGTLGASALSPDGQLLAFGAKLSGTLYVCDSATGRFLGRTAHASPVRALAYSVDGTKLASGDQEGTTKIWSDPKSLTSKVDALATLKGHRSATTAVRFSSDGQRLVTTSEDQTARVWDLENTGVAIHALESIRSGSVQVSQFSPDGLLIAAADYGGVRLWDATSGKLVRELSSSGSARATSVAFSPTDRRLLAVGYSGAADISHVALWDIDSGSEITRLAGATDLPSISKDENDVAVGALAFSPDGKYLVAGFGSKNMLKPPGPSCPLKIWEVATRRLVRRLQGHNGYCVSLAFSRDGKVLASGSRDGKAIIWSTNNWKAIQTLTNPDLDSVFGATGNLGMVEAISLSPDAAILALASRRGTVQLWDVASGQLIESLQGHSSAVSAVAFSPDGRTLASGGVDETVRLWNVETRRELMQLDPGNFNVGQVRSLAFSPDGRHLLADHAFWSAASPVWNDGDQAVRLLQGLLDSNADFQSRVRMFSDSSRLDAALEKLDASDLRVAAALAAAQANGHASRHAWPEAAAAFDRLRAADPKSPADWLRTPALLRVATALFHQDRHRDAAALLTGGAKRRTEDGLPAVTGKATLGLMYSTAGNEITVTGVAPGRPAARAGFQIGDVIENVNDTRLTPENRNEFNQFVDGEAGTTVRFTVRRSGSEQPIRIELTREKFADDPTTAEWMRELLAALDERLGGNTGDPGLFELRAELAGQWSDSNAQFADYTAAIETISQKPVDDSADDLQRLYGRRGNALIQLQKWPEAVADFAQAVTPQTTDEELLVQQATALASARLDGESAKTWTILQPTFMKSEGGATLALQPDGSVLAGGVNPDTDTYVVEAAFQQPIGAIRLEAIPDPSMPAGGSGRAGNFVLTDFQVTIGESVVTWKQANADFSQAPRTGYPEKFPIEFAIDADDSTGWAVYPQVAERHWAVFVPSQPITAGGNGRLTVRLAFHHQVRKHNLGRFRLSVSSDPGALERERDQLVVMKLDDPWQKLAAAYQLQGDRRAIDELVQRHPKLAGRVGDLFIQNPNKDLSRAVEIYSRGITDDTVDAELLAKRARAYAQLANWDGAAADWSRAAERSPEGAYLLAEFAKQLAAANQISLARSQLDKVQALYQQSLQADPDDDQLAVDLAEMLLARYQVEHPSQPAGARTDGWLVVEPTDMKSAGGSEFKLQDGGSILVSGNQAQKETYTIVAPAPVGTITSLRLEAIPHPSLPIGGSGRASGNGNAALAEFGTEILPQSGVAAVTIAWGEATSDWETLPEKHYAGKHIQARNGIDGDLTTYWEVWPAAQQSHFIEFRPATSISTTAGDRLKFTLQFGPLSSHGLGHFRLSVRGDLTPMKSQDQRVTAVSSTTDPWLKLAGAYALNGRLEEAVTFFEKAQLLESRNSPQQVLPIATLFEDVLGALIQRQPDDTHWQLGLARNRAERGRQLLTVQQPSTALAVLKQSREVFTRLRERSQWTVLVPTELKADGDEILTVEEDGRIFVSGPTSDRPVYRLRFRTDLPTLTAIRLETIPDSRLPQNGAGRYGNGNFHLAEFTAATESSDPKAKPEPVEFREVIADDQKNPSNAAVKTVDGNPETYWETFPRQMDRHWAVFALKTPARTTDRFLSITLDSGISTWQQHGLGSFRLSASSDPDAVQRGMRDADFQDSELSQLCVDLAKAEAQQGRVDEAVVWLVEALALTLGDQGKAQIVAEAARWEGALEKLAVQAESDSQLQAAVARHFVLQGQFALAESFRANARRLFEQQLVKNPDNSTLAAGLAEVMIAAPEQLWTVLKPTEIVSAGGATLTLLDDQSILVSGPIPRPDRYTVSASVSTALTVHSIRLEALAHDSLRDRGPGRGENGTFAMENWEITATQPDGSNSRPLTFGQVAASYEYKDSPASVSGHWNISGWNDSAWRSGQDHTAVWTLSEPVALEAGTMLTFQMRFNTNESWSDQSLGRFRLSLGDRRTSDIEAQRLAARKATDPWLKLAAAYAVDGSDGQAARYFSKALQGSATAESRRSILQLAAQFDRVLPFLAKQHPEELQLQLALARSLSSAGKAALAENKPVDALPRLVEAQEIVARLLSRAPQWTTPMPVKLESEIGAPMELQKDGSVFVRHTQPIKNDTYSLEFESDLKGISALRLEVLPDSRLPRGGSGWGGNGNFQLTELTLQAASADNPQDKRTIPLRDAWADHSEVNAATGNTDVRGAADGNVSTGWSVLGKVNANHTALFRLAEEVGDGRPWRLTIRLTHRYRSADHNIGRFRLSFTNDSGTYSATQIRLELTDDEWVESTVALAHAYVAGGQPADAARAIAEALHHDPSPAALARLVERAIDDEVLRAAILEFRPNEPLLLVGHAKWLASRGRWDEAAPAYQRAIELNAKATPPWLQTGYWIVGVYPYGLAQVYPPESNPDPFQPVAAVSTTGRPPAAALEWQPATPSVDGRVVFGTERGCNYALTRIFSPTQQEVAFQLGDDDRLRLFLNDRLLFESNNNGGAGQPKESELAVTLSEGWNTLLLKVENGSGACHVQLALSLEPQDLAAARLGSRVYQAQQLTTAGKADEAVAQLTELIAEFPESVRGFVARAEAYAALSQWELAAADWASADLYADTKVKYGSTGAYCLEQRARIFNRLKQYDREVREYTELLKPERQGNATWALTARGVAYDRLRNWDLAQADYEQAIQVASATDRGTYLFARARHFAMQAQWKPASEDVLQAWQTPTNSTRDWTAWRDAALIHAIAGDVANYTKAAGELFAQQSSGNPNADQCRWTALVMLLMPPMMTSENRPRLLELASKCDSNWRSRLTAMAAYRAGEYSQADQLLAAHATTPHSLFLRAMNAQAFGNKDLARKLFDNGNAKVREQQAKDPGSGVPQPYSWQDWTAVVLAQYEATNLILGSAVGPPRMLALEGHSLRAAAEYEQALKAADPETRSRLVEELAQFDEVVSILRQRLPADASIREAYLRVAERVATDFHKQLDALSPESSSYSSNRAKLVAAILSGDGVLESLLKLRPNDAQLAALHAVRIGDWNNAASHFSALVEQNPQADSVAWMVPVVLWAFADEPERHAEQCEKMYQRFRETTTANDMGRYLKVRLLVEGNLETIPQDAVQRFVAAAGTYGIWYPSTLAFLQYRQRDYAEADKQLEQSLALETKAPNAAIKANSLGLRAATYARQQDLVRARNSLDELKQVMANGLQMKWNADGSLDGTTVLNGTTVSQDKLIAEILRREAEQLIESAAKSEPPSQ